MATHNLKNAYLSFFNEQGEEAFSTVVEQFEFETIADVVGDLPQAKYYAGFKITLPVEDPLSVGLGLGVIETDTADTAERWLGESDA